MIVTIKDFPADYVTKELAMKIANEKFEEWAKDNNICLHPLNYIKSRLLSWQLKNQDLFCGVCGKSVEITSIKSTLKVLSTVAPRSLSLVDSEPDKQGG